MFVYAAFGSKVQFAGGTK